MELRKYVDQDLHACPQKSAVILFQSDIEFQVCYFL